MQLCIRNIVAQAVLGLQAASTSYQPGWHGSTAVVFGLKLVHGSKWLPHTAVSFHALRSSISVLPSNSGCARKHSGQDSTGVVSTREQEGVAVQQQVDDLYAELRELQLSRAFVEKLVKKKVALAVDTDELKRRIQHLWDITNATTAKQQEDVATQISHAPELLNYQPGTLAVKAQELTQQLRSLGLQQSQVQQLISRRTNVLTFRTDVQVQKMQEMSQRLGVQLEQVWKLCLRNRSIVNLSTAGLDHKLQQLGQLLHLQRHDLAKLITTQPAVLVSDMDTVRQRWQTVQECMGDEPPEQLGQAVISQASVLTQRPDMLKYKWRVIQAYAAVHRPSKMQLERKEPLRAALCLLNRAKQRIQLLEYILEQQGRRSSSSRLGDATACGEGAATGQEVLIEGMPLLKRVTNCKADAFHSLIEEYYPGFWAWQKQQLQTTGAEHVSNE